MLGYSSIVVLAKARESVSVETRGDNVALLLTGSTVCSRNSTFSRGICGDSDTNSLVGLDNTI